MSNAFMFDDNEPTSEDGSVPEAESAEAPNNRTFLFVAVGLGGLVLLSLICMAVYAVWYLPSQKAAVATDEAKNAVRTTQAAFASGQTQQAALFTATLPPTVPATATTTPTPVLASPQAVGGSQTPNSTATIEALSTKLAQAQLTATFLPSPTALAQTGFAEDVGLPGLLIMALGLFIVILVARRLRETPTPAR